MAKGWMGWKVLDVWHWIQVRANHEASHDEGIQAISNDLRKPCRYQTQTFLRYFSIKQGLEKQYLLFSLYCTNFICIECIFCHCSWRTTHEQERIQRPTRQGPQLCTAGIMSQIILCQSGCLVSYMVFNTIPDLPLPDSNDTVLTVTGKKSLQIVNVLRYKTVWETLL